MITLVNFANKDFKTQQRWNSRTASWFGGINKVLEYGPENIDNDHLDKHKDLFKFSKGFGNYFWKPYIIKEALKKVSYDDYLVYADSGTVFLKNIESLIDYLENKNEDIICFKLPLIEKQWTKRDAFLLMECDEDKYTNSPQITANFILIKKNERSIKFIDRYLSYCSDYRILSDAPNTLGLPNYPEFNAHRHDQSVLSLLCKKENILVEADLSDYGVFPHKYIHYNSYLYDKKLLDTSQNLFKGTILCNRKVHPVKYATKYFIRLSLAKLGIKT